MYQFTDNLQNLGLNASTRTYRWHGLGLGLVAGWIPAYLAVHFTQLGWLGFSFAWLFCLPAGFGLGRLIKKK